jgi:phage tail fibre protein|nr:MAG TPA: putative tail fiber protein [Caudoviricetes sp.]
MAQSTTNLGKIHVFPSETLYNQFKNLVADNDLALLKDDGAYIIAANLAQNGYVKFSNGLILQWGNSNAANRDTTVTFPIAFSVLYSVVGVPKSSSNLSGSNSNFGVKSQNNKSFVANMYDSGNGYAGFNWCAFGKD